VKWGTKHAVRTFTIENKNLDISKYYNFGFGGLSIRGHLKI
jgi:hypothetical protein